MKIIEKGFFERNKKAILIAVIIFLVSAIAGAVITNINAGDNVGLITESIKNATANGTVNPNGVVELSAVDLFIHNLTVDIIAVLGGFLFSVLSVLVTIFNAVSIASIFGLDLTYAVVTVLPHSIFEYSATILALVCAFNITKLEIKIIKKRNFRNTLKESKSEMKDILLLIIVIVILLVIAAIIEAYITPMIAELYFF